MHHVAFRVSDRQALDAARERLLEAISRGCTEVWQLADRFTVTEKLVRFALDIYGICERVR